MKKFTLTIIGITIAMFSYGQDHGNTTTQSSSESYGHNAGVIGLYNNHFGHAAGKNSTGQQNNFFGYNAGLDNTGDFNVFIGQAAGKKNTNDYNVFIGRFAGANNKGEKNTFLGEQSGFLNTTGQHNTFIGQSTGKNNTIGSGNVFIGHEAGLNETGDDNLYIDNSNTSAPLIYGNFSTDYVTINGMLGVGTTSVTEELTINGKILCEEVEVIQDVLPDYVFQKYFTGKSDLKNDYSMPTLEEVEIFTKKNHHLPEVPSAAYVKENGMQLKEMTSILLQKIEELTLYTIEQEKRIKALEAKLNQQ